MAEMLKKNELLDSSTSMLVRSVIWSTRRTDLVSTLVQAQALGECGRDLMAGKLIAEAKRLTGRFKNCCHGHARKQDVLHHFTHVEARVYLANAAAAQLRKALELGPLKSDESLLFDELIGYLSERPVCPLCRIERMLKGSHIISNSLLKLSGKYGSNLRPRLSSEYGSPEIITSDKVTVKLCCGVCELVFSSEGENQFGRPFREFADDVQNPRHAENTAEDGRKMSRFRCDLNPHGISSMHHTITGIAFRHLACSGMGAARKMGGDVLTLKTKNGRGRTHSQDQKRPKKTPFAKVCACSYSPVPARTSFTSKQVTWR